MMFGVLRRSEKLDSDVPTSALESFGLGGRRPLTVYRQERYLAAVATKGASALPAWEEGGRHVCAAGHVLDPGVDLAREVGSAERIEAAPPTARGSYAVAAYDEAGHRLVLMNDRRGFHPLFVVDTPDLFAFCSEFEPLLELAAVDARIDPDAVAEYYVFGTTLGGKTLVEGVRLLPPGTVRTVDASGTSERAHGQTAIAVRRDRTLEEHATEIGEAFCGAARRLSGAFPDAEFSLTGGADTRLILSCLSPEQRRRHRFVTHYGERGDEGVDRDVVIARRLAKKAGIRHEAVLLAGGHEPFVPDTFADHRAKSLDDRTVHGVLGGELLGGCCVDVALFPVRSVTREAVDRRLKGLFDAEFLATLRCHPHDTLVDQLRREGDENAEFAFWAGIFGRAYFTQLYSGSAGVRTSTWMTPWQMHQRIASPFVDAEFLDALFAVPFEFLSGYRLYNEIYRSVFTEFNDIPTNSGLAVRADSALKMFVGGREPKKARRVRTRAGRAGAVERLRASQGPWARGVYRREAISSALAGELDAAKRLTFATRLKDQYTRSWLFKARRALPVHSLLMRMKARSETSAASRLELPLLGAFADFETWCEYAQVE